MSIPREYIIPVAYHPLNKKTTFYHLICVYILPIIYTYMCMYTCVHIHIYTREQ